MEKRTMFFLLAILLISAATIAQNNQYDIKVKLNEDFTKAECTQKITYANPNDYSLKKLYFKTNNPDEEPVIKIKNIENSEDKKLSYTKSQEYLGIIVIELENQLFPQEETEITFEFTTDVNQSKYFIFKSLRDYWHPKAVPYYDGKLKPYNKDLAKYTVEFAFPQKMDIVSTGVMISEDTISNGYKKVVFSIPYVSNFGAVFLDEIIKEEQIVDDIKVSSYYSPNSAEWTKGLAEIAADIVKFYIEKVGFYPQKIINIIPGAESWGGGFPLASNIFAIHKTGLDDRYARKITAHEIAHTYWGYDYVLIPGERCKWLSIGLGLYTDSFYSPSFRPYRWGYIQGAALGFNTTLMQSKQELEKLNFNWNSVINHSKGFTFIKMLEYVVGKDTFMEIFFRLLTDYRHKIMTPEDLQKVSEKLSKMDLDWFFQPWLYTNNTLDYAISEVKSENKNGKFLIKVGVKRTGGLPMPVRVQVITLDNKKYEEIFPHNLAEGYIEFNVPAGLKDVKIDPTKKLPLLSHLDLELLPGCVQMAFSSGEYQKCLEFSNNVLAQQPDNARVLYYKSRALKKTGRFESALNEFDKLIELKDKDKTASNYVPWALIHKGYIYDLQGRRELAIEEYKKVLELPDYAESKKEAKKRINEPFSNENK